MWAAWHCFQHGSHWEMLMFSSSIIYVPRHPLERTVPCLPGNWILRHLHTSGVKRWMEIRSQRQSHCSPLEMLINGTIRTASLPWSTPSGITTADSLLWYLVLRAVSIRPCSFSWKRLQCIKIGKYSRNGYHFSVLSQQESSKFSFTTKLSEARSFIKQHVIKNCYKNYNRDPNSQRIFLTCSAFVIWKEPTINSCYSYSQKREI